MPSTGICGRRFRAIRDSGGLVGLNYYRAFLSSRNAFKDGCEVTFDEVAAHVEHWLELGGEDTVSLGSDYDGGDVPAWLDGCEKLVGFRARMGERFGRDLADKLFYANARDFFVRNETM